MSAIVHMVLVCEHFILAGIRQHQTKERKMAVREEEGGKFGNYNFWFAGNVQGMEFWKRIGFLEESRYFKFSSRRKKIKGSMICGIWRVITDIKMNQFL